MAVNGSVGTTFSISAGLPATEDQAGYEALTFTEVGQVISLGEVGKVWSFASVALLKDGKTLKRKSTFDTGSLPMTIALDDSDAGQTLMQTARDSTDVYSIKIETPDGTERYSQAIVLSFTANIADASVITQANAQVELTEDIVVVTS